MDTVTIALDWAVNANHSGLFSAISQGYMADEQINAVVIPPRREQFVTQVLVSGEADFAFAFAGTAAIERSAGTKLKSVAAVLPKHNSSLAALKSSGITRPADLQNKRYAGFGHNVFEETVIAAMIHNDGIKTPKIKFSLVRFASFDVLRSDEADFLWIYDGIEGAEAMSDDRDIILFAPNDYGVPNYYAPNLICREDFLENSDNIAKAKRFMRALRRGYLFAANRPEYSLEDILKLAPSAGGKLYNNIDAALASQRHVSAHILATSKWGMQDAQVWERFIVFLTENRIINKPEKADSYFTNALLE